MTKIDDLADRFDRAHENLSRLLREVHIGKYDINSPEYKKLKEESDLEYRTLEEELKNLKAGDPPENSF